jgi:hypothetical protein
LAAAFFSLYLISGEGSFTPLAQYPDQDECHARAEAIETALAEESDLRAFCLSTESLEAMLEANGYELD